MKPSDIMEIMDLAQRARQNGDIFNPLFVSPPGLGKTEIMEQWATKKGLNYITVSLSTSDAPDFKGFPMIHNQNGKQRMTFAIPEMWPSDGEGVIILEELNRTTTATMQCILSLGDKRRGFDGYKLPDGWILAACINPEGNEYDVTTMDHALKDRFEMFNVTYDKKTFLSYASSAGWQKDLLLFVESMWSYSTPEDIKNVPGAKYVSPRTFSKLNAALNATFGDKLEMLIYTTILGDNIGKDFYNFRHNESPVFYKDLISNLPNSLSKLKKFSNPDNFKSGMIQITIRDIIDNGEIDDDLLVQVIKVLPVDQSSALMMELEIKRGDKTILPRIVKTNPSIKDLYKSIVNYGKDKK